MLSRSLVPQGGIDVTSEPHMTYKSRHFDSRRVKQITKSGRRRCVR